MDHEILLQKINKILPKWITAWIAQYLTDRKQQVKCNDLFSEWNTVEAGVVQGSVLGPILFLLFISDINDHIPPSTTMNKYADDILTYDIINKNSTDNTQQTIDNIAKWASDNKMHLNIEKTKHMYINKSETEPSTTVTLNSQPLQQVDHYKYLGVTFTSQMDYDKQWEVTSKTTNQHIYLIKRLKQMGLREEILVNVYRSITLSHYCYNAPLLCSASKGAKTEMQKQQSRFFKIIGINEEIALQRYQIPPIAFYLDDQCKKTVEKITNDKTHPLTKQLNQKQHQHNTRSASFIANTTNTVRYQNSLFQKGLRIMRDGQVNKYTEPKRREATTAEYLVKTKKTTRVMTTNKSNPTNNTPAPTRRLDKNKTVPCPICNHMCISNRGVNQHIRLKHKDTPSPS